MKITLLLLPILIACSSKKQQENVVMALETWNGQPAKDLESHHYFKTLRLKKIKHEDNVEDWVFRDQSRFQTDAYCDALGGCIGLPTYNCDIAFSVKDGVVLGGSRAGSCPSEKMMKWRKSDDKK